MTDNSTTHSTYFPRWIDPVLAAWAKSAKRKPLLLRGARQVGKSSAVRNLAAGFGHFLEINLEDDAAARWFFDDGGEPDTICQKLSLLRQTPIVDGKTLLFLDEIQASPAALAKLRYFYEKRPGLHVVAAGSLLEFALGEIPSFGVGRIHSVFMHPFSFGEFLAASGSQMLADAMAGASPDNPLPEPIHKRLLEIVKTFMIVGGFPEAVSEFVRTGDLLASQVVHDDLLASFQSDFGKYRGRIPSERLARVFNSVARQSPGKFVYERVGEGTSNAQAKQALDLLLMAGLVLPVTHTSANGIPLGAEEDEKYRKMLPCDTGLFQRMLGLEVSDLFVGDDFQTVNKGGIAEIFAGLELAKASPAGLPPRLHCWRRENAKGNAEIDYVVQRGRRVVPVEVKAGTRGAMQSLRLFMAEKRLPLGVRVSSENFGRAGGIEIYPLYAVSNLARR